MFLNNIGFDFRVGWRLIKLFFNCLNVCTSITMYSTKRKTFKTNLSGINFGCFKFTFNDLLLYSITHSLLLRFDIMVIIIIIIPFAKIELNNQFTCENHGHINRPFFFTWSTIQFQEILVSWFLTCIANGRWPYEYSDSGTVYLIIILRNWEWSLV